MEDRTADLDNVSLKIIAELQEDGRRSYSAIAEAVGLSDAAVRQRIKRLTDSGVVQVVAVTDPLRLGFARQALVGIRVHRNASGVAEELSRLSEISYLVHTAGVHDLIAEVVCGSDEQLYDCLERMRDIEDIASLESSVYLKLHTSRYDWGVPGR